MSESTDPRWVRIDHCEAFAARLADDGNATGAADIRAVLNDYGYCLSAQGVYSNVVETS